MRWIVRLCLPALLIPAASCFAQRELTLEEAVRIALSQNRDLRNAELQLESSGLSIEDARNAFRWTIFPDGRVGATEDGATSQVGIGARRRATPGTRFETAANLSDLGDSAAERYVGSVRVELQQPLLKGAGRLVNEEPIRRAESGWMSARRRLEIQRADLVVRVVELHQEIARLQGQVVSDEQSLARNDRLYRLTRMREQQGRATRVDTLRVEFQRGRAELALNTTRERLASARADLADLLALPPETEFLAIPGPALDLAVTDPAEAERVALANRLDYADALQALRDARRGVRVARANLLPTVDLVTRYTRSDQGTSVGDAYALEDETWFVGLAGDTDYPRRSDSIAAGRAQLDAAGAENQLLTLENAIRRQVRQAMLAYQRAAQQVDYAARNHELARNRARLARRLFELGRSDNFTATDAESELFQAESELLRSRSETTIAAYRVLRTIGTLVESPADLKPRATPLAGASARADGAVPP